jgi:transposase
VKDPQDEIAALKDQIATHQVLNKGLLVHVTELTKQLNELKARNDDLAKQVVELTRKLNENSSNSNKPPSSDGLGDRRKIRKKKKPTGRNRGGQPGHKGSCRQMLPAKQVDRFVDVYPDCCDVCGEKPPQVPDPRPWRVQVVEILEFGGREITEVHGHTVKCHCGEWVAPAREQMPPAAFGPRLCALISMLTGDFKLSRRQVPPFLNAAFGIDISLGSVSNIEGRMTNATADPSDEAMERVVSAQAKHVDETSWLRDAARCSVWVFATLTATVIRIAADGRRKTLRKLLGRSKGTLISDRASVFLYWDMKRRQICWSHLLRLFVGFSQRDGPAAAFGKELVEYAELVFLYWRRHRGKTLPREEYVRLMEAVKAAMKPCLERAVRAELVDVSGSCANLLAHWDAMWTFVYSPHIEPTNNHAERELRPVVLWRKRCFGTQSDRGDRFAERMLTVTQTARKQGLRPLDFLHQCYMAMLNGAPAPSLFAAA